MPTTADVAAVSVDALIASSQGALGTTAVVAAITVDVLLTMATTADVAAVSADVLLPVAQPRWAWGLPINPTYGGRLT